MYHLTTFLWLLFFTIIPLPAGSENTITIYYTASLNGNVDGCRCKMNPVAGLVKRAAFLRSLETSGPSLILDAGDIFDEYPDPDLAVHILQVYAELGYDAIAVGHQEFTNGAAGLLEYKSLHGRSDAGTLQAGTSIPAFLRIFPFRNLAIPTNLFYNHDRENWYSSPKPYLFR